MKWLFLLLFTPLWLQANVTAKVEVYPLSPYNGDHFRITPETVVQLKTLIKAEERQKPGTLWMEYTHEDFPFQTEKVNMPTIEEGEMIAITFTRRHSLPNTAENGTYKVMLDGEKIGAGSLKLVQFFELQVAPPLPDH